MQTSIRSLPGRRPGPERKASPPSSSTAMRKGSVDPRSTSSRRIRSVDRGDRRVARRSAMAKLFATETAQQVIDAAIQVHGAAALERGHLLEHLYREVRAPRIYEGTSEIQREIIARDLFRPRD